MLLGFAAIFTGNVRMFALYRLHRGDLPLAWHLLCLIGLLPLCLITLSSSFQSLPQDPSGTLLGGWASGLAALLPLGGSLLLLLAGWLRLGPARLLATLTLGTLAVRTIMLHRELPAHASPLLVSDDGLTVALLAVCSISGLWLLPAAPLRPGRPAWIAALALLLIGASCAWLLGLSSPALPPCSFDPHSGRQLTLCLDVASR